MNTTTIKYIIAILVASFLFACAAEAKRSNNGLCVHYNHLSSQQPVLYCAANVVLKPAP